jgi:hypothetical protein
VLARGLGDITGLPVIELDTEFWSDDLTPLPAADWNRRQATFAERERWIMDGDLGPYDVVEPRLLRADTVVVLDLPLWLCAWRPRLLRAASDLAPEAELVVLRSRRAAVAS